MEPSNIVGFLAVQLGGDSGAAAAGFGADLAVRPDPAPLAPHRWQAVLPQALMERGRRSGDCERYEHPTAGDLLVGAEWQSRPALPSRSRSREEADDQDEELGQVPVDAALYRALADAEEATLIPPADRPGCRTARPGRIGR